MSRCGLRSIVKALTHIDTHFALSCIGALNTASKSHSTLTNIYTEM